MTKKLLTEGGAAGHMRHPFDLDDVVDGPSLVAKFKQIGEEITAGNLPDTKVDGSNNSIKIVAGQFVSDRGSQKELDIIGTPIERLSDRFEPTVDPETGEVKEHGMVRSMGQTLEIFNDDFESLKPELQQLGVLDDPTKFLDIEYVKKKEEGGQNVNVLEYDHDFLKIHGIKQFYEVRHHRTGELIRPGLERPINKKTGKPIKEASTPIPYDQKALDSLAEKVNKAGEKHGFAVYSLIPSKKTGEFDFAPVMSVPVPVTLSDGNIDEKTLGERLQLAKNWIGEDVEIIDPKAKGGTRKPPAQGKEIYVKVLGTDAADLNTDPARQVPLDQLLANPEDNQKAIDGAVFWHATRLLGNVIMDNMEVDHPAVSGPAKDHEGLVLTLAGDTFKTKITGEFILGGVASPHRTGAKKITGLFPGSFKPPHAGHYSVVKAMQGIPDINQIVVLISAPEAAVRSSLVTPEKAKAIWETYLQADPIGVDVDIKISAHPSPIRSAYEYIEEMAENNEVVMLATSTADSDYYPQETVDKSAAKNPNGGVQAKAFIVPACKAEGCDTVKKMSAGDMRDIIDKPEITEQEKQNLFAYMHPNLTDEQKEGILALLIGERPEEQETLTDEEPMGEISAMAGGAVEGTAGGFVGLDVEKENQQEKQRVRVSEHNTNRETNYQYITDDRKNKMSAKQLLEEKEKLEEYVLRKYIRSQIQYKANERKQYLSEEHKIRLYVRQIIKEAKIEDSPTKSTGINKLISVLKVIIPQIEKAYKGLTTDVEQRASFIKHLVHAYINTLSPQKAMRTAYEPADVDAAMGAMAEGMLKEQELVPDPTKFIDIGVRTEKQKEEEAAEEAAKKEEDEKAARLDKVDTKKKDVEAIEDIAGGKQPFPEIPGLDLTGRDWAVGVYKTTIDAITRGLAALHNDQDEKVFEDYLVTNVLLYSDMWEDDVGGDLPDISTPELDAARADKERFAGAPPAAEAPPPPVEETIKRVVSDLISEHF